MLAEAKIGSVWGRDCLRAHVVFVCSSVVCDNHLNGHRDRAAGVATVRVAVYWILAS